MQPAIALLEFSSVAAGIEAGDAMVKRAPLERLLKQETRPTIAEFTAAMKEAYGEFPKQDPFATGGRPLGGTDEGTARIVAQLERGFPGGTWLRWPTICHVRAKTRSSSSAKISGSV